MTQAERVKWAVRWGLAVIAAMVGLFLFDTFLHGCSGGGADQVAWVERSAAADTAKASGKPILLNFTADWCPPCRGMNSQVYSQPEVAARLAELAVPVKVDMTDQDPGTDANRHAAKFGVSSIPTRVLTDADGNELSRQVGGVPAEALLAWLEGGV